MSQFFRIHPVNPQPRLVQKAVEILNKGGVIVYPTDSAYALGCHIGDKKAMDRIRNIRSLQRDHHFTLVCRDLSDLGTYAKVHNSAYRQIKAATPGPYTFILPASREVPKRLVEEKRKTIGLRVPDNQICRALLEEMGEPIMSTTLILPGDEYPLTDPDEIRDLLHHHVDLVIDGGYCGLETTTVVSLEEDYPVILRHGMGDSSLFV
jgi:tRNA threonylcarbamoyl adenosine modification protein (Sua5/YciO/YrdC/YwlC family)